MATVEKRGSGYRITVSMGCDMTGKKIRKTTTFIPPENVTEGKALKLAKAFAHDFETKCQGLTALNENMRFSELTEWYLDNYAPNALKEITVYNYKCTLKNHILPVLGNIKLKDLSTAKMTEFFKSLPLNTAASRKVYITLSSIFTCGVKQGFIIKNPCQNAILPKSEKKEKPFINTEQAKQLLNMLSEYSQFNTIIKLLLYSGMRAGECLALRWEDIDFENNIIRIVHTLTYTDRKTFLSVPKTKNSKRLIKISPEMSDCLKTHRAEKIKEILQLGELYEHPEMVFTAPLGKYVDRSALNMQLKKFVKDTSFPFLTLHGLRHCNATLLINSGIPIKVVSEHLGHCDIGVTANIYAHVLEESKIKVAEAITLNLK